MSFCLSFYLLNSNHRDNKHIFSYARTQTHTLLTQLHTCKYNISFSFLLFSCSCTCSLSKSCLILSAIHPFLLFSSSADSLLAHLTTHLSAFLFVAFEAKNLFDSSLSFTKWVYAEVKVNFKLMHFWLGVTF